MSIQWTHDDEIYDDEVYKPEPHDVEVERELIREANERHAEPTEQDKRWLDLWVSFGLLALMTLFLLAPKALRWFYLLWK